MARVPLGLGRWRVAHHHAPPGVSSRSPKTAVPCHGLHSWRILRSGCRLWLCAPGVPAPPPTLAPALPAAPAALPHTLRTAQVHSQPRQPALRGRFTAPPSPPAVAPPRAPSPAPLLKPCTLPNSTAAAAQARAAWPTCTAPAARGARLWTPRAATAATCWRLPPPAWGCRCSWETRWVLPLGWLEAATVAAARASWVARWAQVLAGLKRLSALANPPCSPPPPPHKRR